MKVPGKRYGQSSITHDAGLYAVSYAAEKGEAKLMLIRDDGTLIFSRDFINESFLVSTLKNGLLFARGSENLYCYSIHQPAF